MTLIVLDFRETGGIHMSLVKGQTEARDTRRVECGYSCCGHCGETGSVEGFE